MKEIKTKRSLIYFTQALTSKLLGCNCEAVAEGEKHVLSPGQGRVSQCHLAQCSLRFSVFPPPLPTIALWEKQTFATLPRQGARQTAHLSCWSSCWYTAPSCFSCSCRQSCLSASCSHCCSCAFKREFSAASTPTRMYCCCRFSSSLTWS